ncbi:pyruvate formate-lyase-activating protein [Ruminiclostridium cellulolyticum]|uniref:Pyruvate formate-lyase-activating enzyme n=1 Tax=Ruminiclostridium cellulolyticum (strain ATCC 35319 / DSM 5812 / JCM 6584 / H10) TaxID=394503 RepID=B8I6R7_RUMCH|nr:pyruvate formate-lyase-activating protein [Ruminiclostridium cellulolyticum]ACL76909.1 pyruvate formate-lyase activating enzyme [Ruminiclostridium cellulolyticum H10]
MEIKGRIHSFETFGTVDGPGIRFIVFLKGCPLRCKYCHNRDAWSSEGAKLYSPQEVLKEIQKYRNFIDASHGGITVSGGEPLIQHEFVKELFKLCREAGIHTAVDTSGYVNVEDVKDTLEYTDLVLLDLKQANAQKHLELTGVENKRIKLFTTYLGEIGKPVWIRYVLIPGYTDGEEDLLAAYNYLKGFKNIEKIEVLPYHIMGKAKWEKLNVQYPLEGVPSPTQEEVDRAKNILTTGKP